MRFNNIKLIRLLKSFEKIFVNNRGFTLVEIIVATAVSSLIMIMIYSAHRSVMSSVYDLTGIAEFYENVNLTINRIDREISCAYYDKLNKNLAFIGENAFGEFSNGKLNFVTVDHKDFLINIDPKSMLHQSDVKEVGYYLKQDEQVQNLFLLIRREQNPYDEDPESGGQESIMLVNVIDVKFEFNQGRNWDSKWDSRDNKKVPQAVKTTLKIKNYRGNDEKFVFISYINLDKK